MLSDGFSEDLWELDPVVHDPAGHLEDHGVAGSWNHQNREPVGLRVPLRRDGCCKEDLVGSNLQ